MKMNEDELIDEIIKHLKLELPDKYINSLEEFEELVKKDLLRASYNILDELKRKKDWSPSLKLLNLIRNYQVVF
jgi:predicted AAA+ superfamily ATPase